MSLGRRPGAASKSNGAEAGAGGRAGAAVGVIAALAGTAYASAATAAPHSMRERSAFAAKQPLQLAARLVGGTDVSRYIGIGPRSEEVAEVGGGLVADFFGRGLATVLGDLRIVLHAHATDVQLGAAARAFVAA